jgi:hypothetical protein
MNSPSQTLPLIPSPRTYSYPKESDKAPTVRYFPLDAILTRAWTTDAHTTAYSVETHPYRLSRDAVAFDGGVVMVVFIADVDGPEHVASDDWWLEELAKLDALRREFPGAFIYRTRGGYRILYLLPSPRVLDSSEAVERWRSDYLSWVAALRLRFQIFADPSCHDWQRLYRVPHATRAHGRPEAREMLGSPYQTGAWTCNPTEQERDLARTLAKRPQASRPRQEERRLHGDAGDGVLFSVFKDRGWLGHQIEPGKWAVQCPWQDQHSKGQVFNTSTVLWAPGAGEIWGWLHCSHSHCQTRDIRDVLKVFTEDELTRAKRDAGVITSTSEPTPFRRLYQPYFGLRVKGVRHAS